jgi:hypothetical protein
VSCFKIYTEGSGDTNKLQAVGREAMTKFLSGLKLRMPCRIIMCGGRQQAFNDFCVAMRGVRLGGDIPLLLVDAEDAVSTDAEPWVHLKIRDKWDKPEGATNDHAFLMVQTMEAWLVCDPSAWKAWNQRVDKTKLLAIHNNNVEFIGKENLESRCESICKSVGESYLKNKRLNGFRILKGVQPALVRENSNEAKRFFDFIEVKKEDAL